MGASDKIAEARRLQGAAENGTLQGAMTGQVEATMGHHLARWRGAADFTITSESWVLFGARCPSSPCRKVGYLCTEGGRLTC